MGDAGDMGMAVEDGGESSGGRVEVEGVEVVERVDVAVGNEDDFGFREFAAGTFAVDVTADRGYGGDFAQVIENGDFAYVAEVEDARDAGEGGEDFGAEEAVGVADDSDFHLVSVEPISGGSLNPNLKVSSSNAGKA